MKQWRVESVEMGKPDVDTRQCHILRPPPYSALPCFSWGFCKDLYLNSFHTFLSPFSGETKTKRSLLQFVLTFAQNKDGFVTKVSLVWLDNVQNSDWTSWRYDNHHMIIWGSSCDNMMIISYDKNVTAEYHLQYPPLFKNIAYVGFILFYDDNMIIKW